MPTVEERLASLEARMDAMTDLRNLITELRADMNRQFGDVTRQFIEMRGDVKALDQKVDSHFLYLTQKTDRQFAWLVSTQVALLLAVVGVLLGAYYP